MKFVICCSMSQIDVAREMKDMIENAKNSINICEIPTDPVEGEPMYLHRNIFLNKIDDANMVLILQKPDGTIGESTGYELSYCVHTGKTHLIVNPYGPNEKF